MAPQPSLGFTATASPRWAPSPELTLQPSPPWLLATRAVKVLAACGAVWLSVREQHPYQGPAASDVPILAEFIVLNFSVTVAVRRRAHRRPRPVAAAGLCAVLLGHATITAWRRG